MARAGRLPTLAVVVAAVSLTVVTTARAIDGTGTTASYVGGRAGDWFDPANWSTGRVPDGRTTVRLRGADEVVADAARARRRAARAVAARLVLTDAARLTTSPGTVFSAREERVTGGASVVHHGPAGDGELTGTLVVGGGGALVLGTTAQSRREATLASTVEFTLGGTRAAKPRDTGRGRYANLTAESVHLDGRLAVVLADGFTPRPGDAFQIITAARVSGRFTNAAHGDQVAEFGGVGLYVSYTGGDGNDVVLMAR